MENINIASFDFDESKIISKLEEIKDLTDDLNLSRELERRRLADLNKEYNSIGKEMEKLTKEGKGQTEEYDKLVKKQDDYLRAIVESKSAISDISTQTRNLNNESKQLNKTLEIQTKQQELLSQSYDVENKSIDQLREDRKLLIQLRNQEVAVMGEQSQAAQQLNKVIEASTNQEKKLVAETEKRFYQIGDYANQLEGQFQSVRDALGEIAGGNITGGFKNLTTSVKGLGVAMNALPFLAIIAGFVAIGKAIWDYNSAIKENLNLINQLTGATGTMADEIRQSVQSIADTYNRDFRETLEEVKELAQDFGLTYKESLDLYNDGLVRGGYLNKEFGDSIREYGVLFQQNGYSAKEFINIINTGFDLGIYTDKLPDAIKEAGISLKEGTKATKDALTNAFGASFSNDILKRVQSGAITVKDALNEISTEAQKANLDQQQWAELTASVFRGAGEDAGGAQMVFEAVYKSIDNLNEPLTEVQQKQEELRQSYEDLERAKDTAFKSEVVMQFQKDLEILWNKGLKVLIEGLASFIQITVDGFTQINAGLKTFDSYLVNIDKAINNLSFNNLKQSWEDLKKSITNFDWSETYEGFAGDSSANGQANRAVRDVLNRMGDVSDASTSARLNQLNKPKAGAGNSNKGNADTKSVKEAKKKVEDTEKDLETMRKLQEQYYRDLINLAYQYGQSELEKQIKLNADKIKNAKILTQEMLDITKQQIAEETALREQQARDERQRQDELVKLSQQDECKKIEELKISEEQKNQLKLQADEILKAQLLANEQQYGFNLLEIAKQQEEQTLVVEQMFYENRQAIEQQRKDFEFQQKMLRLENEGATELDMRRILLAQEYTEEMALLRDKKNQELITNEEFKNASIELTKWKTKKENEIEDIGNQQKLSTISQTLDGVADLIGKNTQAGKIAASASALINTWAGITEVWKTPSLLPEPYATISKVGSTATVLASGLNAVKQINKVNTKALATGGGGNVTSGGGTTTNTYKASYAGGSTGLEGNSTISGYNQSNLFNGTDNTSAIADAVREGAENGARQGSQSGLRDLATDRQIMESSGY